MEIEIDFNDAPVLENYYAANISADLDELTSTFRMLYKLIYNGVIQSEEGEYGFYIFYE